MATPEWIVTVVGDARLAVLVASLLPLVEPRYAVLLGVSLGVPLREAIAVSLVGVAILAPALTMIVGLIDRVLVEASNRAGVMGGVGRVYLRLRASAARRARGAVEKWGMLGLIVFVAAPLPATGMYTGALAAMVLGVRGARLAASLAAGGIVSVGLVALGYTGVSG